MKLTMLGTGNALVTKCYNTCFVFSEGNDHLLVDGGGGNTLLSQLEAVHINWKDIKNVFITHKHIDHLLGIIWFVRMVCQNMNSGQYVGEVNIYGHDEVMTLLNDMLHQLLVKKQTRFIGERVHLNVVEDGEQCQIMNKTITFFDIHSTKDKQFGFCLELNNGEKLTCLGDEPYNEHEYQYAYNSKWLLHEAFCLYSQADIFHPYEKHHSTVKDACELAQSLNIDNLVLYHSEDKNIEKRKELYLEEGKQYYQGNIFVPDDLEVIEI